MKKRFVTYTLIILLSTLITFGHGEDADDTESKLYQFDKWILIVSLSLGILAVIYSVKKFNEKRKNKIIAFSLIVFIVISITAFLTINTVYNNVNSWSRGPVHWHADFEIWICNNLIELKDPDNIFTNKIGSPEAHEHNDNRIHIEGLIKHREDALLGSFFKSIGGNIGPNSISIPIHDQGTKAYANGDLCNNKSATFFMFVNGESNNEFDNYLIKPYPDVPPGDKIKFVFTEKPLSNINKELGSVP